VDREQELAELAAFCTATNTASYLWWRAPAWAGKSALMSWFVLHPPAGVRVVSFFITARWAAQSDRIAFTDVVVEQLAELLDEPMPSMVDATRDLYFLDLLHRATEACQAHGEHLILLVDGLDEDRGVTAGPEAHSIAALLPVAPPAGARIIVTGRPQPPIPTDVPEHHPLRDRSIVRPLARSARAAVVREDMLRELTRLLHGSPAEQVLLGLITAAGGGLSAHDLTELTGCPTWEIEDHLHAVAGRSFKTRPSRWRPDEGPQVYVLAHEELQVSAVTRLGHPRLEGYQSRLHRWANRYKDRGWPAGTPEYLFRGYYRMLHNTGDVSRLVEYALDPARHDRMLGLTGGDSAAMAEINTAQDIICGRDEPDLLALARLAIYRSILMERNTRIPTELPALWARLGYLTRGEALVDSIASPRKRVEALTAMVRVSADAGDHDRARLLANKALTLADAIIDPATRAESLSSLVREMVRVGDVDRTRLLIDRAEAAAHAIVIQYSQAAALATLAKAVSKIGDLSRAEVIAESITDRAWRAAALAVIVEVAADCGDIDRARQLMDKAQALTEEIPDPGWQAESYALLVQAAARAGDLDRARVLTDKAEMLAESIADAGSRAEVLSNLIAAVAYAGDLERVRRLTNKAVTHAESMPNSDWQAEALTTVVRAVTDHGPGEVSECRFQGAVMPRSARGR
jgi:tetratricopeptide (TPR) repeat protein